MELYELYEEAASFELGSVTVYPYGIALALGMIFCLVSLAVLGKNKHLKAGTAALYGAIAMPLMFVLARLFYCLLDMNFSEVRSLHAMIDVTHGGFAMSGALVGASLAALIVNCITKDGLGKVMDAVVPSLLLFILFERIGEQYTALGLSRTLNSDALNNTFLVVEDGDYYLRTWMLEAFAAAVLYIVSLLIGRKTGKDGFAALKTALLFAAVQVLLESLRYDNHMMYSFVGLQHIMSMLLLAVLVIAACKIAYGKKAAILSLIMMLAIAGLLVFIEFKIDRSDLNRFMLYGVYTLALCVPAVLGVRALNKGEQNGKGAD